MIVRVVRRQPFRCGRRVQVSVGGEERERREVTPHTAVVGGERGGELHGVLTHARKVIR